MNAIFDIAIDTTKTIIRSMNKVNGPFEQLYLRPHEFPHWENQAR